MPPTTPLPPVFTSASGSTVKGWLAVLAVTLGIFALMTSELLPVGLLTPIGSALQVSEGTAGLMVTVPGLVAALSAPLVTVATGRLDRRLVLAVLIGLVGVANLASAYATGFTLVLIARVLIGVSVGGFWSLSGGIALRLVPEHHTVRATAVIFGGVEAASVLGVPLGTLIGDSSGWRTALAAVGLLGLVALAGMIVLLPRMPARQGVSLSTLPRVFRSHAGLRLGLVMTFLVITGHFTAYTFARPILYGHGVQDDLISTLLLSFGAAGLCGNFIAGALIKGRLRAALVTIALIMAAAMLLLATVTTTTVSAAAFLIVWGLGYGAVPVTFQSWILRAAPAATEAASSLYVAMFNLSIALGALIGGFVVDALPAISTLGIGAALILLLVPFIAFHPHARSVVGPVAGPVGTGEGADDGPREHKTACSVAQTR